MRLRCAIGCLLWIFAYAPPTVASAARGETSVASSFPPERGLASTIVLGGANANRVTLDIDPVAEQYVISDAAGITAGHDCITVNSQTVRCARYRSPGESFQARLRGGDDTFEMLSQEDKGLWLSGGKGADKLLAGAGDDVLGGGGGADTVTGRSGSDRLFDDRGRDRLIAGMGRDRLHASDNDSDRAINCGPGKDLVLVDRGQDPRPIRCERVRHA